MLIWKTLVDMRLSKWWQINSFFYVNYPFNKKKIDFWVQTFSVDFNPGWQTLICADWHHLKVIRSDTLVALVMTSPSPSDFLLLQGAEKLAARRKLTESLKSAYLLSMAFRHGTELMLYQSMNVWHWKKSLEWMSEGKETTIASALIRKTVTPTHTCLT